MATIRPVEGTMSAVTPPRRARTALLAALLAACAVLSGCGGDDAEAKPTAEPSVDLPTGNVEVPAG